MSAPDYVLGYSEHEQKRLLKQASILRGFTEGFFRAGGLAPGMRVLDLGCGMGDVSLLAADLVGPTGSVLGVDRDPQALARARERAAQHGCAGYVNFDQIHLDELGLDKLRSGNLFDAAVGRYVLLYQSDPGSTLRRVASLVKPGGRLIFHELDFGQVVPPWPNAPLWVKTYSLMSEAFRRGGNPPDFGRRLARTFLDAGLPWPTIQAEIPVGGEPGSFVYGWVADTVRSLLPRIEQFGLATAAELEVETLAARMEEEAVALGAQLIGPTQFGAWTPKP
jgi:ubiquinone/menaquinone biosynthesis C-methylase UbiE